VNRAGNRTTVISIAIALPLIALLVVLVTLPKRTERNEPNEVAAPAPIRSFERPPSVVVPAAPLPRIDITSDDVERIRMRLLAEIAEDFRASIEADTRGFSLREALERAESERERYALDPAWPRISALPGVAGFEIQECPQSRCVSDWLADEADDPAWSRPMESKILEELAAHSRDGLSQVFVTCRRETCGILLPRAADADSADLDSMANLMLTSGALGRNLDFAHRAIANRPNFQAIYLTNRGESPEMMVQ
jgi:hypothetical protein